MSHRYRLKYRFSFEPGEFHLESRGRDDGLTDALLLASIIYPSDGSLSVMLMSKDGRTGKELADLELFKVWSVLCVRLAESETLPEGHRQFAEMTMDAIKRALGADRRRS